MYILQAEIDGERLISDVINNISRPIAFDAVMRVRTSTGVRATDFYGHYFMSNTTDMELASIDCDKVLCVALYFFICSLNSAYKIIRISRVSRQSKELYIY